MARRSLKVSREARPRVKEAFVHPAHNYARWMVERFRRVAPAVARKESLVKDFLEYSRELAENFGGNLGEVHRWDIDQAFRKNLLDLAQFLGLDEVEFEFLAFAVIYRTYPRFRWVLEALMDEMAHSQIVALFGLLYEWIPVDRIETVLLNYSLLGRTGLVVFNLPDEIEMPLGLAGELYSSSFTIQSVLEGSLRVAPPSRLTPADYDYLPELGLLRAYLAASLDHPERGTHIFLYGPPGSGKTELARLLAREVEAVLYEPLPWKRTGKDRRKETYHEMDRFFSYTLANHLLEGKRALILFDDADTFLNRMVDKSWFNRVLEENAVPTIWICNSVEELDPALARRFDLVVFMDYMPPKARKKMLRYYLGDLLEGEEGERWLEEASSQIIPPAVAAQARRVLLRIKDYYEDRPVKALNFILSHTLNLMGLKEESPWGF
ncbi:MAG: hypothetical protein DSZ24_04225 [Thermodesulfatator sp.]|nr:MAG: hypothetical protein DSZ24_04225 [Thermodesulfatator sp.]